MNFAFDTELNTLNNEQLQEYLQACWDKAAEISQEQERRHALPWVWASETQIVRSLRTALGTTPKPGAAWAEPSNVTEAYLDGDTVTHDGFTWVATGEGAIMHAPGIEDPVMGVRWQKSEDHA